MTLHHSDESGVAGSKPSTDECPEHGTVIPAWVDSAWRCPRCKTEVEEMNDWPSCSECGSDETTVNFGYEGVDQHWSCKDCGHEWDVEDAE